MINLFEPRAGDRELAAVGEVLGSGWLGTGPRVRAFERAFGSYIGGDPAAVVAVTSCTEGLFQAVAALDLGHGDEVVLPTISFVGAAHAVRSAGAGTRLCDVDPVTLNPSVEHVERALTPRTRAVVVLHYGGAAGDIADIAALAEQRSIALVEDAALALGSSVAGRACGTFGDVGVWSFDAMKVATTGDGGMVWCRSERLAERVRRGVALGGGASGLMRSGDSARWWEVDPPEIGRRAAMNDVAAAIGLVQLERLPGFLERRRQIAAAYDRGLGDLAWLSLPRRGQSDAPTFYWVQAPRGARDRLASHLLERGIYTNFRYWPLHRMAMYASGAAFAGADRAAASTLLLPCHQGLSNSDVERVVDAVRGFAA